MPERNCNAAAEILGCSKDKAKRWSKAYHWDDRVMEWDRELDYRIEQAQIEEAQKMVKRQIALSLGLQEAATYELQALARRAKHFEQYHKVDANGVPRAPILAVKDIVRLIETGTKLERVNRGEPTDIVKATADGQPIPLVIEFVRPEAKK